jgi:hypothetical protein
VQAACNGVAIEEFVNCPQISIAPNPVKSSTAINLDLPKVNTVEISIYNTTGICLKNWQYTNQQAGQKEYQLNLADIPSGMYLCRIKFGDEVVTKKIIKL